MASFLALPDDAAHALAAFLDALDLENVTSITRAASRSSYFRRCRDAKPVALTLPSTTDDDRCPSLIHGIYRRDPQRLASLQWIQVTAPWQVELLVEESAIALCIQSIRVTPSDPTDTAVVDQICVKLCGLPRLHKLDVASTLLETVDEIARMTELRDLDLSGTNVKDLSALVTLTELRVLVLENTFVEDIACIRGMAKLEILRVSQDRERKRPTRRHGNVVSPTAVPSLQGFSHLHTLVLQNCSVESTADIIHVASSLLRLELTRVCSRHRTLVDENEWPPRDVHERELLARLTKLEIIQLDNQDVLTSTSSTLAQITSLRVVKHFVHKELRSLETLVKLEEISLRLPEGDNPSFMHDASEDYAFLLQLPQLKKITIEQTTRLPRHWTPDVEDVHDEHVRRHATTLATLAEVLPKLPNLTILDYTGFIPNDMFLPPLKHLRHLGLHSCTPEIMSFHWIRDFESLRSLDLTLPANDCDISAIGELSTLESFRLVDTSFASDAACYGRHRFLTRLTNLKVLELRGYAENLELLCGMAKLETLKLQFSCSLPTSHKMRSILESLHELDSSNTTDTNTVLPLVGLPRLRQVTIPATMDCRPLVADNSPPRLLRVYHPLRDCVARCAHRDVLLRRECESQSTAVDSDEDKGCAVFGDAAEDY